jgi:hypothetical protein
MPESLRVVARFSNGRTLKGNTQDFKPTSPRFHLFPAAGGEPVAVQLAELKALFFVKDLAGKPSRPKLRGFIEAPAETAQGKKVAVRFRDAELLCGYTLGYSRERAGFFLFPADRDGNNLRVFVMTGAADEVALGPAAEQLAEKVLASR